MIKSVFPDKDPKKISDEVKFATFVEVSYSLFISIVNVIIVGIQN